MKAVPKSMTLTEQAIEYLKDSILLGDLVPGRVYTASELGQELQVSRTPIRGALQELERRGLVKIEKNKGVQVLNTSVESLIEVFQVRLMLEVPLSRRATELRTDFSTEETISAYEQFRIAAERGVAEEVLRADRDFHKALMAGARNDRARTVLQEQRDFVLSTGMGTVPSSRTAMECFDDHSDIMEAFLTDDVDGVGKALARHISNTAKMLIKQETRDRPDFANVDADESLDWLLR